MMCSSSVAENQWQKDLYHKHITLSIYEKHVVLVLNQVYYWVYKCTTCHHYTNIIKAV